MPAWRSGTRLERALTLEDLAALTEAELMAVP